jgi:hypothetical protein
MRDACLDVEEMEADTLFNWDHFFPLYGDPDGEHFECWVLLGAMAEVTESRERHPETADPARIRLMNGF